MKRAVVFQGISDYNNKKGSGKIKRDYVAMRKFAVACFAPI